MWNSWPASRHRGALRIHVCTQRVKRLQLRWDLPGPACPWRIEIHDTIHWKKKKKCVKFIHQFTQNWLFPERQKNKTSTAVITTPNKTDYHGCHSKLPIYIPSNSSPAATSYRQKSEHNTGEEEEKKMGLAIIRYRNAWRWALLRGRHHAHQGTKERRASEREGAGPLPGEHTQCSCFIWASTRGLPK